MNRRIFLKLLGLSPVVPSVLMAKEAVETFNGFAVRDAKMRQVSQDIYGSPDMLEMRRSGCQHVLTSNKFDGRIVNMAEYHGRFFVACEHSVYEIYEDNPGDTRSRCLQIY